MSTLAQRRSDHDMHRGKASYKCSKGEIASVQDTFGQPKLVGRSLMDRLELC